tara:strand:- start:12810 stop:13211 length:402 start_codon:yes stop_codon:yes gene_type:complete
MAWHDEIKELTFEPYPCPRGCGVMIERGLMSAVNHDNKCVGDSFSKPHNLSTKDGSKLFFEDLEKWWNSVSDDRQKFIKKREETINGNLSHLHKKSIEFKEDIPLDLLCVVSFQYPLIVGSEFIERHKKWVND